MWLRSPTAVEPRRDGGGDPRASGRTTRWDGRRCGRAAGPWLVCRSRSRRCWGPHRGDAPWRYAVHVGRRPTRRSTHDRVGMCGVASADLAIQTVDTNQGPIEQPMGLRPLVTTASAHGAIYIPARSAVAAEAAQHLTQITQLTEGDRHSDGAPRQMRQRVPSSSNNLVIDSIDSTPRSRTPTGPVRYKEILVDALKLALSLAPAAIALWGFGVEPTLSNTWPLALILMFGVISSARDVVRWITTRYRVTETHVERRTGLFVRTYRSIPRERIRSVEAEARLRHKLFRLRMVKIGAGQQNTSGESALVLDAISRRTALHLREQLLEHPGAEQPEPEHVLQDVRYHWVIYNIFDSWTYVVAAGALWAGYLLLTTFNVDPLPLVRRVVDWEVVGWGWTIVTVLALIFALGVAIRVLQFFNENWGFRLSRVQGRKARCCDNGDCFAPVRLTEDDRLRGASSPNRCWRWMRIADTGVITTGLSV